MSQEENKQNKHQPYVSPAMLSIAADEQREAMEKRRLAEEKERQRQEDERKKQNEPQKKQPYQPFTFVRADIKEEVKPPVQKVAPERKPTDTADHKKPEFTVVDSSKKSAGKPSDKQNSKPSAKPAAKNTAAKPAVKPTAKPAVKPAAKPTVKQTAKKKKRKNNYILYYLGLGGLSAIVLLVLSLTVLFPIQNITVKPTDENITLNELQAESFAKASGIKPGENLWRIGKKSAERQVLLSSNTIDAVQIKRKLPGTVVIEVNMAQVQYVLYDNGTYHVISENGRVMEVGSSSLIKDRMVVYGFTVEDCEPGNYYDEKAVLDKRFEAAEAALSKVKESNKNYAALEDVRMDADREVRRYELFVELLDKLGEYEIGDITAVDMKLSSDISFVYDDRIEVSLGGYTDIDYKLALAKKILFEQLTEEDEGVLNLSVPELPGFKAGK